MEDRLRKYARLAVQGGVHLQKGQTLMIHADVMAAPFVRMVTEEAYACGAREVVVRYGDEQITRLHYLHHPYVKPTTKKYLFFLVPMIQLS